MKKDTQKRGYTFPCSVHNLVVCFVTLFTFLILITFTNKQYQDLHHYFDLHETYLNTIADKEEELNVLNKIQSDIKGQKTEYMKYLIDIKESELIDYIYTYVESLSSEKGIVNIKSIDISGPKKNELGFLQRNVTIDAVVSNEWTMYKFLDFLIASESQYSFFLENFSYPNDGREKAFGVSIPLKIFYK